MGAPDAGNSSATLAPGGAAAAPLSRTTVDGDSCLLPNTWQGATVTDCVDYSGIPICQVCCAALWWGFMLHVMLRVARTACSFGLLGCAWSRLPGMMSLGCDRACEAQRGAAAVLHLLMFQVHQTGSTSAASQLWRTTHPAGPPQADTNACAQPWSSSYFNSHPHPTPPPPPLPGGRRQLEAVRPPGTLPRQHQLRARPLGAEPGGAGDGGGRPPLHHPAGRQRLQPATDLQRRRGGRLRQHRGWVAGWR